MARLVHLRDSLVRIVVEVQPPTLCVSIEGELDLSCCQLVEAVAKVDLAGVTDVMIVLRDLEFCDIPGLRALVHLRDQQREEGREIRFVEARPIVRRLAQLTGYDDLLAEGWATQTLKRNSTTSPSAMT
jgi:anti-anti-sigma factor